MAEALNLAEGTVFRIKRRFTEEGLQGVLNDRPQAHRRLKLDDRGEAHLIALACSEPPEGYEHWSRVFGGQGWWSWGWCPPCPTRRCACT